MENTKRLTSSVDTMSTVKSKKRLLVDLSEQDHRKIKGMAAARGITMRLWVMRALAEQIKREKQIHEQSDNT